MNPLGILFISVKIF